MKKTMAMVLVVVMMLALGASVFAATGPLTVDQAKEIALHYTDVNAADAVFTKAYQTVDDGRHVYEIEFVAGNMKYEMDVDMEYGNVTDYSVESCYGYGSQNYSTAPYGYGYYDDDYYDDMYDHDRYDMFDRDLDDVFDRDFDDFFDFD